MYKANVANNHKQGLIICVTFDSLHVDNQKSKRNYSGDSDQPEKVGWQQIPYCLLPLFYSQCVWFLFSYEACTSLCPG